MNGHFECILYNAAIYLIYSAIDIQPHLLQNIELKFPKLTSNDLHQLNYTHSEKC